MARPPRSDGKRSAAKTRNARPMKGRNPKTQAQKTQTAAGQTTAAPDKAPHDSQRVIADLLRQLDEARAELSTRNTAYGERIAYQAATNDVLRMMSASPSNPQPVFDLIAVRARDLCNAYGVTVYEFDGSLLHWRAATGVSEA